LLSNSAGYTDAQMVGPMALAIDASGNIWVANSDNHTVTKFIGMAAPVVTPKQGPPQPL
jgi:hypothetical protein